MSSIIFSFKIDITDDGYKRAFEQVNRKLRSLYKTRNKKIQNLNVNIEKFKKEVSELMIRIAVEATQELIMATRGTTGNLASGWHVTFNKRDRSEQGVYGGDFDAWYSDTYQIKSTRNRAIYDEHKNEAIARERNKLPGLLDRAKTSYTVYIINSAYMEKVNDIGDTDYTYGYYAEEGINFGWFANKDGYSINSEQSAGEFLANYFKNNFKPAMKQLRRKYKMNRG